MIKTMEITITVSEDTEANCDELLVDTLHNMIQELEDDDMWEEDSKHTGDIDKDGWEAKWEYKTNVDIW